MRYSETSSFNPVTADEAGGARMTPEVNGMDGGAGVKWFPYNYLTLFPWLLFRVSQPTL